MNNLLTFLFCFCLAGQALAQTRNPLLKRPDKQPVMALDGRALLPPPETPATVQKRDSMLRVALDNYRANPNLENLIWYGRRLGYCWRFRDAIAVFSKGIRRFPESPELYRHRGHRYITIRQFDRAIADFAKAAALAKGRPVAVEPDGLPNRLNQPLSTLQFNIYYHWALAHYLKGDFRAAAARYEDCLRYSGNPDLLVSASDWLYMTYRCLGEKDKAEKLLERITPGMVMIESDSYYKRLLLYKGLLQPGELLRLDAPEAKNLDLDIVTQGYGVGNWYGYNGDKAKAQAIFKKIVATPYWSAFGYIAAEAALKKGGF